MHIHAPLTFTDAIGWPTSSISTSPHMHFDVRLVSAMFSSRRTRETGKRVREKDRQRSSSCVLPDAVKECPINPTVSSLVPVFEATVSALRPLPVARHPPAFAKRSSDITTHNAQR